MFLIHNDGYSANFDCKKKNQEIEYAICSDPILSQLDELITLSYSNLSEIASSLQREKFQKEQNEWLMSRNVLCDDIYVCMELHAKRLIEIKRQISPLQLSQAATTYSDMNQLSWDRDFQHFLKSFFSTAAPIDIAGRKYRPVDVVSDALGGPPEQLEHTNGLIVGKACATHACDQKGIVVYRPGTQDALFGLTVLDTAIEKPQKRFMIFYKNRKFLEEVGTLMGGKMQTNLTFSEIKKIAVP